MLARTESYWFEGLKFAEDDIQIGVEMGVTEAEFYESPTCFFSEKAQNEFHNGYYSAIEHYKTLGIIK